MEDDFISFGEDPEASTSRNASFSHGGAKKRKLNEADFENQRGSQRMQPWCANVDWRSCSSAAEMLGAELDAFHQYILPTEAERALRTSVVESIRKVVRNRWYEASVDCFGSFATELYLPNGDIDLVVTYPSLIDEMGGYYQGGQHTPETRQIVKRLNQIAALLRVQNLAKDVVVISKARVPIVKFISVVGSFPMDISVNMVNGLNAVPTVQRLFDSVGTTAARTLVMTIKAFLHQRGLNEVYSGGLGSYAVVCLVVSFLQLHPNIQTGVMDANHNIGSLLIEFFELYGKNFNYDDVGIQMNSGGGYYSKARRGFMRQDDPFRLSIEDPADASNDIAQGTFNLRTIRQTFSGAYDLLTTAMFERIRLLSDTPNHWRNGSSLLACVLSTSPEDVERRQAYENEAILLGLVDASSIGAAQKKAKERADAANKKAIEEAAAERARKEAKKARKEAKAAKRAAKAAQADADEQETKAKAKAERKAQRRAAKEERREAKRKAEAEAAAAAAALAASQAQDSSADESSEEEGELVQERKPKQSVSTLRSISQASTSSSSDDEPNAPDESDADSRYQVHMHAPKASTPASKSFNADFIRFDADEDSDEAISAKKARGAKRRDFWKAKARAKPEQDLDYGDD